MIEFWRDSDIGERIFIVGAPALLLGFAIAWGHLLYVAYQLDSMAR